MPSNHAMRRAITVTALATITIAAPARAAIVWTTDGAKYTTGHHWYTNDCNAWRERVGGCDRSRDSITDAPSVPSPSLARRNRDTCKRERAVYFDHHPDPLNVPRNLRRFHGCHRYRIDYKYHRHTVPAIITVRAALTRVELAFSGRIR
jgi:hypothetical protein